MYSLPSSITLQKHLLFSHCWGNYQTPEHFWISCHLSVNSPNYGSISIVFVGLRTAPPFLWPAVQTSKSTFHNRNCILHTEKKTHRNLHQSRFLYSWGSRKERKMGQAEFPRTQFCHDHDMTENLMMAKDDAKIRKVSATYPSVTLSPPCVRAKMQCYLVYCATSFHIFL